MLLNKNQMKKYLKIETLKVSHETKDDQTINQMDLTNSDFHTNLEKSLFDQQPYILLYHQKGSNYLEVDKYSKIENGRAKYLEAILLSLLSMADTVDESTLFNGLHEINDSVCHPKLSPEQVDTIFEDGVNKFKTLSLDIPHPFNVIYCFDGDRRIIRVNGNEGVQTILTISDAIFYLNCELKVITKSKLVEFTGLPLATINQHWSYFHKVVKHYNKALAA